MSISRAQVEYQSIDEIKTAITALEQELRFASPQNWDEFEKANAKIVDLHNALVRLRQSSLPRANILFAELKNITYDLYDKYKYKLSDDAEKKIASLSHEELFDFDNWQSMLDLEKMKSTTLAKNYPDIVTQIENRQEKIKYWLIRKWDEKDPNLTTNKRKNAERKGLAVGLTILLMVVAIGLMAFPPAGLAVLIGGAIMSPGLGLFTVGVGLCTAYGACDRGMKGGRCTGNGVMEALKGAAKGLIFGIPIMFIVGLMIVCGSGGGGTSGAGTCNLGASEDEILFKKFDAAKQEHNAKKSSSQVKDAYKPDMTRKPEGQLGVRAERVVREDKAEALVVSSPLRRAVVNPESSLGAGVQPASLRL